MKIMNRFYGYCSGYRYKIVLIVNTTTRNSILYYEYTCNNEKIVER